MQRVYGFTGLNASGKSTAAKFLVDRGYNYTSLSDCLREEAQRLGLEASRDNLYNLGNQLRKKDGSGALGKIAAEKILQSGEKFVVDSIRNPAEIDELRKIPGFTLVAVEAEPEARFKRAQDRGRNESASTLQEFIEKEKREMSESETDQQLHRCVEKADIIINNNSTLEDLKYKIESI